MKRLLIIFIFSAFTALAQQPGQKPASQIIYGPTLPATCSASLGQIFYKTTATIGGYQCLTTDTWTVIGAGAGGPPTGAAGGDLYGTYASPGVKKSVGYCPDTSVSAN